MRHFSVALIVLVALAGFGGFVWLWDKSFTNGNALVVYFGRPGDVLDYVSESWRYLLWASLYCLRTAIISMLLAGFVATILLTIGLLNDGWLQRMELLAAWSQVVPFLVIVTVFLLFERAIFGALNFSPGTGVYSLAPVTVSLVFPPLVYGSKSIIRMQIEIKSLLRLWQAPTWWRIYRVYLPSALPDILTGLRTSATWAVGATLISDGLLNGVAMEDRTLGHLLIRPFSAAPPGQTVTVIIISTLLALGVYSLFVRAQSFLERWLLGSVVQTHQAYL